MTFHPEPSPIGRIVIPETLPPRFALFYTTSDFPGRLDETSVAKIAGVIRERFGIDAALTTCVQIHGTAARQARPNNGQNAPAAARWRECDPCDALWSSEKQTALGIKVADCLPVTLIDPTGFVIANIHSGWRGAARRIVSESLAALRSQTEFNPAAASAWLGPSIRVCCFEVGEEVVDELRAAYGDVDPFVDGARGRKPHVDLTALTRALLHEAGIAASCIFDSELCTRCEGSIFHSYRRDGRGGRNLAVVAQ
ncbi:MAG TPA: polyphenol oxidase family protein [Thermoanaerobaculia bacterium]|nr:polyphenol oxidase family protein [Thermoanaerobaculia bacterium]